jgi:hypothetical protein
MEKKNLKTPKKGAGTKLRELSKKRREGMKPSKEFLEILQNPVDRKEQNKKSARPHEDTDLEA